MLECLFKSQGSETEMHLDGAYKLKPVILAQLAMARQHDSLPACLPHAGSHTRVRGRPFVETGAVGRDQQKVCTYATFLLDLDQWPWTWVVTHLWTVLFLVLAAKICPAVHGSCTTSSCGSWTRNFHAKGYSVRVTRSVKKICTTSLYLSPYFLPLLSKNGAGERSLLI